MKWPYGAYKGEDIEDIPSSYLKWALAELDEEKLLIAVEDEVKFREKHNTHFEAD